MSDSWVLTKLNQVAGAMTDNLEHYEMGLAAAKIDNSFLLGRLLRLVHRDRKAPPELRRCTAGDFTAAVCWCMCWIRRSSCCIPSCPSSPRALYQALPGSAETIMTQAWPTFDAAHNWAAEEGSL